MRTVAALIVREVKHHFFALTFYGSLAVIKQADDAAAFDLRRQFRFRNACPLAVGRIEVVADDPFVAP